MKFINLVSIHVLLFLGSPAFADTPVNPLDPSFYRGHVQLSGAAVPTDAAARDGARAKFHHYACEPVNHVWMTSDIDPASGIGHDVIDPEYRAECPFGDPLAAPSGDPSGTGQYVDAGNPLTPAHPFH